MKSSEDLRNLILNDEGLTVLSEIGFKGVPAKVKISDKENLLQYVLFDSFYHRIFLVKRTFHVLVCDFLTVLQNIKKIPSEKLQAGSSKVDKLAETQAACQGSVLLLVLLLLSLLLLLLLLI